MGDIYTKDTIGILRELCAYAESWKTPNKDLTLITNEHLEISELTGYQPVYHIDKDELRKYTEPVSIPSEERKTKRARTKTQCPTDPKQDPPTNANLSLNTRYGRDVEFELMEMF